MSPTLRAAIWVAIGALVAAAVVCVVWVLMGEQSDIIGRAFLTILLLAAFAGAAILDVHLAPRRPAWFALTSMGVWVATLLIGAVMIWMPAGSHWGLYTRLVRFLLIVLILQLALLHLRLFMKAFLRHDTPFTRVITIVTLTLVASLAVLLVLPLMLTEYIDFSGTYWRVVVAVSILAAVGTALIPLMNLLLSPRGSRPAATDPPRDLLPWPMFVDGFTPLPMLPDGSPDWNAYYTGHPSPGAHVFAPAPPPPSPVAAAAPPVEPRPQPGYEGYPPPPPLPPRP
jgi:hypothetical protein